MKFLHLTFHFEYEERIEEIFDRYEIENYVRYSMMDGKDRDGKHYGTQVYPGNATVIQAQLPEDQVDEVWEDLKEFKESKKAHQHLEAIIVPVEARLS